MKLVVAEKPSVARHYATLLGATKRAEGYLEGNGYYVTYCLGHLVTPVLPEGYDSKYKDWALDTLPITPPELKMTVIPSCVSQYKIVKKLMLADDVTEIIEATDAGREGELIFRLVYNHARCKKPVKRLWVSSQTDNAVLAAFQSVQPASHYDKYYHSAKARQYADWIVGMNLSRVYSLVYKQNLSVGRVQTPTLKFLVDRHQERRNFVPKPFYVVTADCGAFNAKTTVYSEQEATDVIEACTNRTAYVTLVEQEQISKNPPLLFSLALLQRVASAAFGYTAKETLALAQSLYEKKLITYPRTSSSYIPSDMAVSVTALVQSIGVTIPGYDAASIDVSRIVDDAKVSDHFAILPEEGCFTGRTDACTEPERHILLLILCRLIEAVYPPHVYLRTKAVLDINNVPFSTTGREILAAGYTVITDYFHRLINSSPGMTDDAEEDDCIRLPPMSEGNTFTVMSIASNRKETTPPASYTDGTLIKAMTTAGRTIENKNIRAAIADTGIGTEATRAEVIETLLKRGYAERNGKYIDSTEKGETLISLLPNDIKAPELTAIWEMKLKAIEDGSTSTASFKIGICSYVQTLIDAQKNVAATFGADTLGATFKATEAVDIGKCPRCGKRVTERPKSYACEDDACNFIIWKDNKFFKDRNITLAKHMVKEMLSRKGRTHVKGLRSFTTGKTYDAYISIKPMTGQYVNFEINFK